MLDINTGVAEARTLHPSADGWFAIFRKNVGAAKTSDRSYPMGSLDAVVRALDKVPDAYVSQASFVRASRKVANFKSINCAFVDIDCYSGEHNSPIVVPDDAFIERLHEHARNAGIPTPSYTTLSGRGVYCKWVFDKPLAAHQLIRWKALQSVLVPLYTAFGVDAKVKDAARVLRIMGSAHAGTGSIVRVGSNTHQVHNFDALCAAAGSIDISKLVLPPKSGASAARAAKNHVRRIKSGSNHLIELNQDTDGDLEILRTYEAMREPVMLKMGTRDHLNWSRFVDLRTLAEARGGIHVGSRDIMMFWMATTLAHAGVVTSQNIESEIGEMLGAFSGPGFDPIGERSMMSLVERLKEKEAGRVVHFKGGSYDPLYTPTNDHLIDVLGITAQEQCLLTTIIGGREKLRRADAKVEGRADRREHRLEWRGLARQMQADALAAGETRFMARIAREVEVDVRQVSRFLTGELQRDPLMVETRGRKKRPTGTMVRIVVARRGGLSRSVWVNADQAEADNVAVALRKAMDRDRDRTSKFVPRPLFDPDVDVDLGDESRIQTMTSTCFGRQWLGSVAIAFPNRVNRVVFSITRKREEKKRALARETQSEVFQAGGPRANLKPKEIPSIQRNSAPPATSTQVWTGWGPLIRFGAARTGITGNRQANQKPIASEGWVKITRADGKTKSIRILPLPKTTRATRAKAPTPIYMDAKTGEIDFVLMRAEAARITQEQKVAKEAARIRDVALDEAQHAQGALAAANRLKEIRDRAMSKSKSVEPN